MSSHIGRCTSCHYDCQTMCHLDGRQIVWEESTVPSSRAERIGSERGRTHGLFSDNADFAILARNAMRSSNGWNNLTRSQQLALEEIQLKIARIVSGPSSAEPTAHRTAAFKEHWDDIGGYSNLGGKDCV